MEYLLSKSNKSFASKVSINVILLVGLLLLAAMVISTVTSVRIGKKEAYNMAMSQLKITNLEIENILFGITVAVDNMAAEVEAVVQEGDRERLFDLTRQLVAQNEYIKGSDIGLVPYYFPDSKYFSPYSFQRTDSIETQQVGSDNYAYHIMEWYLMPQLLGKPYWTDPFFDEGAGNIVMCTYTRPLYDANNMFIGVLTADLSMDWLAQRVNALKTYAHSYNFMIGKNASYILHPDPDRVMKETIFTRATAKDDSLQWYMGQDMLAGKSGFEYLWIENERSYVFYEPLQRTGWSLAMVCPFSDVYSFVFPLVRSLLFILIGALIVLYIVTRHLISSMTRPLTLFAEAAREIAKGDFNVPLPPVKTQDELRVMHDSLHYMQDSLRQYIADLESTTSAKERIESELNIARDIQMGMLPKIFPPFPERHDVDLYAKLRPAKEVGGDLYDFFIHEEKLYLAIGDVSGKGVPASLLMAVTRSLFRSVAATMGNPQLIVESMNRAIAESNEQNMFVTMFVGILDLSTGHLSFCNAGHNPPCLIDEKGKVTYMDVHQNLPLGLFAEMAYDVQDVRIKEGQTLFMYTDGLTEAENNEKTLYGEPRLLEVLGWQHQLKAEDLVLCIFNDVEVHAGGAPQSDDLTMMACKYYGNSMKAQKNEKRLSIYNQVAELTRVTEFIDALGEEQQLSPALTMSLNLAMEEAVSNVIFYAYPNGEDHHLIQIIRTVEDNVLTLTIRDDGKPFDPTAKEDADITLSAQERQIGGLGIYMVKQIMDTVTYSREDGANILVLTKKLA